MTNKDSWIVDLELREVRHTSGAEASFYAYHSEEDWQQSDTALLRNGYLYPDGEAEFARAAKRLAVARGMKHCCPSDESTADRGL